MAPVCVSESTFSGDSQVPSPALVPSEGRDEYFSSRWSHSVGAPPRSIHPRLPVYAAPAQLELLAL